MAGWRATVLDVAVVSGLLAAAMLLRLPDLMLVPRFTDETLEVLIGLRVARGDIAPLVGVNTHIGALFNYLVAGAFSLLGPRPDAGRLTALAFGVLGIIPTYLLGRRLGGSGWQGRAAGTIAGLLLACSSADILVTSRIAYSHSLTPCFTTFGLWLLHRALALRSGRSLALSGLAFGLALQTHVTALAIWPGLALYVLIHRRAVGPRWLLAGLLGLASVANLVAYNVLHGAATLNEIVLRSGRYGGLPTAGLDDWPRRLWTLLRSMAFAVGGRVSEQVEPSSALLAPPVLVACGLLLTGLVLLVRRREWLPLFVITSAVLSVSLLNDRVEPVVVRARHYAPVLPLAFAVIAVAVVALSRQVTPFGQRWLAPLIGLAIVLMLVTGSQLSLREYVDGRLARVDENNAALLSVVQAISRGARSERVYLDVQLAALRTISGGRMYTHVRYLLLLRGQEIQQFDLERQTLPISRPDSSRRVVLNATSIATAANRYRLEPLPGDPGDGAPIRVFRAYPLRTD